MMNTLKLALPLALAASLSMAGTGIAETIVYSNYSGPKHSINELALPPWFEAVKTATNGELDFQLVTGGQLITARETAAGVGEGIADMGMLVPAFAPAVLPSMATMWATLVFGSDVVAIGGAAMETMLLDCPSCKAELEKANLVAFAGYTTTPYMLMCTKKVTTLADMKGLKVRASGSSVKMMEMAGATPVAMNPADGATAMQRGTVDCVLGIVNWLENYGYQDVAKHLLDFSMGAVGPVLHGLMNRDTWNGLSDAHKQAVVDAAPMLTARGTLEAYYEVDQEVLRTLDERGVARHAGGEGLDEMVNAYQEAAREIVIAQMKSLGLEDPGAVIDAYQKNLEKWRKLSPEIDHDSTKFAAALKREVYDKLTINDY